MILLETLEQDRTWTDVHGTVHLISDMEPRYCRNVVAFLHRNVDKITLAYGWNLCVMPMPNGEMAYDMVMDSIDREMDAMGSDPDTWLAAKPLLKALRRRGYEED